LKFTADFHLKMGVCRHELGGSTPPNIPTIPTLRLWRAVIAATVAIGDGVSREGARCTAFFALLQNLAWSKHQPCGIVVCCGFVALDVVGSYRVWLIAHVIVPITVALEILTSVRSAISSKSLKSCCTSCMRMSGVPRRQPHRRPGLANLSSAGAVY